MKIFGDGQLATAIRTATSDHPAAPDLFWACDDTPVTGDEPDVEWIFDRLRVLAELPAGHPVLVSSQLPVGSCARLEGFYPELRFAVSPENIRIKTGVEDFRHQARVIVGTRHPELHGLYRDLLARYTQRVIFMCPESAEMTKHALNGYLGMCIAYINEIAELCDSVGANIDDVTEGLMSERRVSPDAPLRAGPPFSGGTLGRDLAVMRSLAPDAALIPAISESNRRRARRA